MKFLLKLFKPKNKSNKCPKCGAPLTVYNYESLENGKYYIFCMCGYDSREE